MEKYGGHGLNMKESRCLELWSWAHLETIPKTKELLNLKITRMYHVLSI